jgi:competence protein ComEA
MTSLDQQYRNVLIFLIVVILAGSGYWILKHFRPALFLGAPELIVGAEEKLPASSKPPQPASALQQPVPSPEIVVHVTGAVQSPGVYRLSPDARIQDAIEKAGGAGARADVHLLNLAAKIRDGQQIHVPSASLPQAASSRADVRQLNPSTGSAGASPSPSVPPLKRGGSEAEGRDSPAPTNQASTNEPPPTEGALINLNTATSEQLQTLPRIGPVAAQRIIEYRETYGPFSTIEELTKVKGIGEKTLEKIRHLVVVS